MIALEREYRDSGGAGLGPAGAQERLDRGELLKEGARGGTLGSPTIEMGKGKMPSFPQQITKTGRR